MLNFFFNTSQLKKKYSFWAEAKLTGPLKKKKKDKSAWQVEAKGSWDFSNEAWLESLLKLLQGAIRQFCWRLPRKNTNLYNKSESTFMY